MQRRMWVLCPVQLTHAIASGYYAVHIHLRKPSTSSLHDSRVGIHHQVH